jgi:endosialidase-like protein
MNTTTLPLKHSMNRTPYQLGLLLIPLVLACFGLSLQARATCQEGCDTVNLNTFLGEDALTNDTTGDQNTAIGYKALYSNTLGSQNTAIGAYSLFTARVGNSNTAIGNAALFNDTFGVNNVAIGASALYYNTTGYQNTATGTLALRTNTTGYNNTANGYFALQSNTAGNSNAANGFFALVNNSTGNNNTADGFNALYGNTTGNNNIALGFQAGQNLTTGDNNIDIGNVGVANESSIIRIGATGTQTATFIAGIRGVPISGGTEVGVNASGQLGVRPSSARYKDAIQPMDKASESILALKPVTFRYKQKLDPKGIPQFGLVAEDVEKVNPDLVARDDEGKPYTVRYEAVNAMLLNEFLKEHHEVQELKKQVAVLTAGLQKVSAQLELSKPAPQTVLNNP